MHQSIQFSSVFIIFLAVSFSDCITIPPALFEIYNAVNSLQNATQQNASSVCYQNIGCFNTTFGEMAHLPILPLSPEKIDTKFYAFMPESYRKYPKGVLIDPEVVVQSINRIRTDKRLVMMVHGYGMGYRTRKGWLPLLESLLKYASDDIGTVIGVDWRKGATLGDYAQAVANSQVVGRQVAFLVNQLVLHRNVDPSNVYLIGFSLGAHVCGFAAKYARAQYGWKVGRITGLDPGAGFFEQYSASYLNKEDAHFVDGIHTSIGDDILAGQLGMTIPFGHVDFYPNGGQHQPSCVNSSDLFCNHYQSVYLYEASLSAKNVCHFRSYSGAHQYLNASNGSSVEVNALMGFYANGHVLGKRYLKTTSSYPYCDE